MIYRLQIAAGQFSAKGRKPANQDFHGVCTPPEPLLSSKGCAIALADGISTSAVGREAAETAVTAFFEDYFSTPETWSVKQSAQRVLMAVNSWLYAQTRQSRHRYDKDKGYVCTFSAMIIKSCTAHIFHVGDSRVYRLSGGALEQLTRDHRIRIAEGHSYLGAALGADDHVEIEYHTLPVEKDDVFLLATDGVYEYAATAFMAGAIRGHGHAPEAAARAIVDEAYARGSTDNLTAQVIRIEDLPARNVNEVHRQLAELPWPPGLESGARFDGFRIVRQLHTGSRSHVFLAVDEPSGTRVAVKTLSTEMRGDPDHLERFLTEEWIARRINNPYVVRAFAPGRKRHSLYTVTEFIEGRTLTQWMADNPRPDLESVRELVEQIARGLRAFHRLEMIHQDLRPDNVMIDRTGTVKLIDFGATRVAGIAELAADGPDERLGTAQYSAPEYFLGEAGTHRSDIFSLGVIAYQMLTQRLPYGARLARARSRLDQLRLKYIPARHFNSDLPAWVDGPLKKALHPDPNKRYAALSEFIFDLRHPRHAFSEGPRPPLIERHPVGFWQGVSFVLALTAVVLGFLLVHHI